jgi:hypothetical protein
MKRSPWLCALAVIAVTACTDSGPQDSGVDSKKQLSGLSSTERQQVCSFFVTVSHGPRTQKCDNNITVQIQGQTGCVDGLDSIGLQCTATVADAESCGRALGDDACKAVASTCTALFACQLDGG